MTDAYFPYVFLHRRQLRKPLAPLPHMSPWYFQRLALKDLYAALNCVLTQFTQRPVITLLGRGLWQSQWYGILIGSNRPI